MKTLHTEIMSAYLLIFIPLVAGRFFFPKKPAFSFLGEIFLEIWLTLFFMTLFCSLPKFLSIPCIALALILTAMNLWYYQTFGANLALSAFTKIESLPQVWSSLKASGGLLFFPLGALFVAIYCLALSLTYKMPPMPWLALTCLSAPIASFFFYLVQNPPYITAFLKNLHTPKLFSSKPHICLSKTEVASYLDPKYPFLKHTHQFTGKKKLSFEMSSQERPDVFVILMESFRAKNVGVLGNSPGVTPCFDSLSQEGALFSNFHSNATQSFKALYHILYGNYAPFGSEFRGGPKKVTNLPLIGLPDLLKKRGYQNVFLHSGSNVFDRQGAFLKNHGFDLVFGEEDLEALYPDAKSYGWGIHDEYLYRYTLEELKPEPLPRFHLLFNISNHHPYQLREGFSPSIKSPPKIHTLCKRYLKTMEYSDQAMGEFVEALKKRADRPLIFILGDHGVPMRERSKKDLYQGLYEEYLHVPLLFLAPGRNLSPQVISDPTSHIDISTTLMDLLNLSGPNISLGSSLCREIPKRSFFLINESVRPIQGAIEGSYKYIKELQTGDELFFNLEQDPQERVSNSKSNPKVFKRLKQQVAKTLPYITHAIENQSLIPSHSKIQETSVRSLILQDSPMRAEELAEILKANPKLESLQIQSCFGIHSLPSAALPSTLKSLVLKELALIDDEDLKTFPEKLSELTLIDCPLISDEGLAYLAKKANHLKTLHLSVRRGSIPILETLGKALTSIQSLTLEGPGNKLHTVLKSLPEPTLQRLKLEGVSAGADDTLWYLKKHPLKKLEITDASQITDAGLEHLASLPLQSITIRNALQITDAGIAHLKGAPLQGLTLSYSPHITEKILEILNLESIHLILCTGCPKLPDTAYESPFKDKSTCFIVFSQYGDYHLESNLKLI